MFGFLTSSGKDVADPLISMKSASSWLRQLPALDVIGRQQHVMRAFDAVRQSRKPIDIARAGAIQYLDAALAADRRQLTKQYVENVDAGPKLSVRLWHAVFDLTQGFIFAYQVVLDEAIRPDANPRWKPQVPILFARLLHYYGTDAKLRVARYERWIPAKWMELHRTYLRAAELGVDRVPVALGPANANATQWTVEQEYLFALLVHQLNTGNLSPVELDWGSAQLRAWSRRVALESVPLSPDVIYVPAKPRTRPGEVVKQTPRGGFLSANGRVRLWVSAAQNGLVPNLIGSSLPAAREQSRKLKLRLKIQYGDGPEGTVLKQSLDAGIAVRPGLPLTLLVGRGSGA